MHVIKLEKFEGPLQLLYQLIEDGQMEITEVALGKVTENFLNYVDQASDLSPDELADFLVVAAKLLLLKSKAILPRINLEVEEGPTLEEQLKMYKEFVLAAEKIEERLQAKNFVYFRPALIPEKGFYPPASAKVTAGNPSPLLNHFPVIFREVLARLEPILKLPQTSLVKAISIKAKIKHIYELLKERSSLSFTHLLSLAKNKTEMVVSLLALLELIKQKEVTAEQGALFEDIVVKKL